MFRVVTVESRRSPRKRVLKGGIIAYCSRHATLPCVVRDISESGARLAVEVTGAVPDTFELIIELEGFEASCSVVWRRANEVGVRFVGEPVRVPPKRSQVIASANPISRHSLRRAPPHAVPASGTPSTEPSRGGRATRPATPRTPREEGRVPPILIAEDDPDDRFLLEHAFREAAVCYPHAFVDNGSELLAFLGGEGAFATRIMPALTRTSHSRADVGVV